MSIYHVHEATISRETVEKLVPSVYILPDTMKAYEMFVRNQKLPVENLVKVDYHTIFWIRVKCNRKIC